QPMAVRILLGRAAVVGFSTHTSGQVEGAAQEPISYIAIGPVFGTRTKDTGYTAVGLAQVTGGASRRVIWRGGGRRGRRPRVDRTGCLSSRLGGSRSKPLHQCGRLGRRVS